MRDLSNAKLSIEPADSTSWSDVRTDLIAEAKNKLRAELEIELAAAPSEEDVESLRAAFSSRERRLEHDVDSKVTSLPFSETNAVFQRSPAIANRVVPVFVCTDPHILGYRRC